jgi:hypothetical protein
MPARAEVTTRNARSSAHGCPFYRVALEIRARGRVKKTISQAGIAFALRSFSAFFRQNAPRTEAITQFIAHQGVGRAEHGQALAGEPRAAQVDVASHRGAR